MLDIAACIPLDAVSKRARSVGREDTTSRGGLASNGYTLSLASDLRGFVRGVCGLHGEEIKLLDLRRLREKIRIRF